MKTQEVEYATVLDVARRLGVSRFVIYRRMLAKKIEYTIVAGHYCIPASEIERLVEADILNK